MNYKSLREFPHEYTESKKEGRNKEEIIERCAQSLHFTNLGSTRQFQKTGLIPEEDLSKILKNLEELSLDGKICLWDEKTQVVYHVLEIPAGSMPNWDTYEEKMKLFNQISDFVLKNQEFLSEAGAEEKFFDIINMIKNDPKKFYMDYDEYVKDMMRVKTPFLDPMHNFQANFSKFMSIFPDKGFMPAYTPVISIEGTVLNEKESEGLVERFKNCFKEVPYSEFYKKFGGGSEPDYKYLKELLNNFEKHSADVNPKELMAIASFAVQAFHLSGGMIVDIAPHCATTIVPKWPYSLYDKFGHGYCGSHHPLLPTGWDISYVLGYEAMGSKRIDI